MRFIWILALCLCGRAADWKDVQPILWFNNVNPGIALTASVVHQIDHAVGSVTRIQIGDQTGILPSMCTGLVTAGSCPQMQDCEWDRDHNNVFNDTIQFVTCRPLTCPITYIATNIFVGQPIVWFQTSTKTWLSSTLSFTFPFGDHVETFSGGETGWAGSCIMAATPAGGDSGSPVFTTNGDFIGSVVGLAAPTGGVINYLYPNGSQYRPANPTLPYTVGSVYDDGE